MWVVVLKERGAGTLGLAFPPWLRHSIWDFIPFLLVSLSGKSM
jgi:hypothetical protein